MGTLVDHQCMIAAESAYGTAATVSRPLALLADTTASWAVNPITGRGLTAGTGAFPQVARRVVGGQQGEIEVKVEAFSSGLGLLLQAMLGTGVTNAVAGVGQQQLFTPSTGGFMPSLTVQLGIVRADAAGTVDPMTFSGCSVTKWMIEAPENDIPTISATLDARAVATATALGTPTWGSGTLFHTQRDAVTIGGTVTVPTTTALASGGTSVGSVRAWSLEVDNGLDTGRWVHAAAGGRNRPTVGRRAGTLKIDIEYDATTWRDAMLAGTQLSFTSTMTGAVLGSGVETLQTVVPALFVDEGGLPQPTDGEVVRTELTCPVFSNAVASPVIVAMRTADLSL